MLSSRDVGPRLAIVGVCLAVGACSSASVNEPVDSGYTSGPTPADDTADETSTGEPPLEVSSTSSGGETDEPPRPPIDFDVGVVPDPGEPEGGCTKIDFLFVIDDSSSMAAEQDNLVASFPGFIDAIQDTVEDVDSYHVGVITTDDYAGNHAGCRSLGDLVTRTSGAGASNYACGPYAEGHRFATEADDLEEVFPCMAKVGTAGSALERPVTATLKALDAEHNGAEGCNGGFIRHDAILVVVIVSDDPPFEPDHDDAHPQADDSDWYTSIVEAKGGDAESIVMIGFVPKLPLGCTFAENTNLIEFVERFGERGVVSNICDGDFASVFAETVATIDTTCGDFVPQG